MTTKKGKDLVSIESLSKDEITYLLDMTEEFERHPNRKLLEGKVVATLFFEPSTRTRLSFETAANRLGARVIGFTDPKVTSSTKGETLNDTIQIIANYADVLIMRHYLEGAAKYASEVSPCPIINAGDGANQHPSQTMLDVYSIKKTQKRLDNLSIYLVGDLKYGRTVHSLLMAMSHFNPTFHFISPQLLSMPEEYKVFCKENNIPFTETSEFNEDIIANADILYMTRVQRERFFNEEDYIRLKDTYILDMKKLETAKDSLSILHPLPRVNEISTEVDDDPRAAYFRQVLCGKYIRMALILELLGIRKGEN